MNREPKPITHALAAIEDVQLRGIGRGVAAQIVQRIVGDKAKQERLDVAKFNSAI